MQKKPENSDENKKLALQRMQALCSKSEKCSGDIRQKLANYNLDPDEIADIIQSLISDKFIDDQRFSLFYTRDKFRFNQWGKRKIYQSLILKGIPEYIINESLNQIDEEDYHQMIIKLMSEKNRTIKDTNIFSRKGKLFRFAAQKGFESELIYKAIEEILN